MGPCPAPNPHDLITGNGGSSEYPNPFAVQPCPGSLVSQNQFDSGLEALLHGISLRRYGPSGDAHGGARRRTAIGSRGGSQHLEPKGSDGKPDQRRTT